MEISNYLTKDKIAPANNIYLIEFAKYHGYILENGSRRALSGGLYLFRAATSITTTDTRGGPIDFVMQFMQMDFREAVAYLLETILLLIKCRW
ncbi:hypothetical protein [Brevibacillus parabrevis]|uniref:hypothetical protein n=1 Tax=Brevibacillus parabrevis TaxID=54914 RepID=UPI002E20E03F|nr:hypothetical protein [Brevibacillus parabrevis]